ncbi:MAG: TIGR04282 family arsenosugar biosynthesis glycosyltransferase [Candidatus Thorarchaeota archaeon]|jgi:rSAM/selenodomain-associated transferase 1
MINSTNKPRSGIFIVMKYPEIGKVKLRLAESIGEEAATNLYRAFIQDTLANVHNVDIPFHIAVYPPETQEQFAHWLGPSYDFFPQEGMNLGERLHNGFAMMFKKKYQQVIALASDCPDLPGEILQMAASKLQSHDVVIGPSPDGGYYLIGFSEEQFIPEAFFDLPWGTEIVFQETLARIEPMTNQVYVLPEWQDIDTKTDLRKFYETYQLHPSKTSHAMDFLRNKPELLQILFS